MNIKSKKILLHSLIFSKQAALCVAVIITAAPIFGETLNNNKNNKKPKRIAVLDFSANNTSASIARIVRNTIEVAFFNKGRFVVLERSKIDMLVKIKQKKDTLCKNAACASKIGKLLKTDYVVIGSVDKLDIYTVTIKVVDTKKNKVVAVQSREVNRLGTLKNAVLQGAKHAAEITLGERKPVTDSSTPLHIGIGFSYLYPLAVMHKIVDYGTGVTLHSYMRNKVIKNSLMGVDCSYFYIQGNRDETKYMHLFSSTVYSGYTFSLFKNFYISPAIGAGVNYSLAYYYPYSNKDLVRQKTALLPALRFSAVSTYTISTLFSINIQPSISFLLEQKGLVPYVSMSISGSIRL